MPKLKVGFFSFTGCEGCVVTFLEILNTRYSELLPRIDIRYARILKARNELSDIDVAFVEGAISSEHDAERLRQIRASSKRVVAIGSCAANGSPSNARNSFDEAKRAKVAAIVDKLSQSPTVVPLKSIVKVDAEVQGCAMIEQQFLDVLNNYLREFNA
jgi:coenzyme F420-reducing hydrogenase gamma subunit